MKQCQSCGANRIVSISGKTSDMCSAAINGHEQEDGYPPSGMNIGGGDYLEFDLCLQCGKIQGKWPVPITALEQK